MQNESLPANVCTDYLLCRDATDGYARNITGTARRYQATLDSGASAWDHRSVNQYLAWLRARKTSAAYVNSARRHLIILWRHAYECGLADDEPNVRRLRISKDRDRKIRTFSIDEVRLILESARTFAGSYRNGIPRSLFWLSFVRAKWDTGLRHSDLLAMQRRDIGPDGLVILVQNKTGRGHDVQFSPETIKAIDATFIGSAARRRLIWPWDLAEFTFQRHARQIVERAGLCGNMKMLRASAGSAYEDEHPGRGHELLGNDRSTFVRFYRDISRISQRRPLPPSL